jgi:hypothetical protein
MSLKVIKLFCVGWESKYLPDTISSKKWHCNDHPLITPPASSQDVVSQSVAVMMKYLWFLYITLYQWAQAQNSAFCKEYP